MPVMYIIWDRSTISIFWMKRLGVVQNPHAQDKLFGSHRRFSVGSNQNVMYIVASGTENRIRIESKTFTCTTISDSDFKVVSGKFNSTSSLTLKV